jgi:membrane-associated phospholipid phosphatase
MYVLLKFSPSARKWFWAAFVLLALFLIYTIIFSTGLLTIVTIQQEQWLLHRPLTGLDCVFHTWSNVGEVPFSVFLTLITGVVCLRLGYRRRILLYLLLLLMLSAGVELVGKQFVPQPLLTQSVDDGLNALQCSQIDSKPLSTKVLVLMGMWWAAPPATQQSIHDAQQGATIPFNPNKDSLNAVDSSYPSGHAIRWSFLGAIACWLIWRHMRRQRVLRVLLMVLALVFAFGGGFAQFYVGAHLTPDVLAGYLMGFGFACCAIGLLSTNEKSTEKEQTSPALEKVGL